MAFEWLGEPFLGWAPTCLPFLCLHLWTHRDLWLDVLSVWLL